MCLLFCGGFLKNVVYSVNLKYNCLLLKGGTSSHFCDLNNIFFNELLKFLDLNWHWYFYSYCRFNDLLQVHIIINFDKYSHFLEEIKNFCICHSSYKSFIGNLIFNCRVLFAFSLKLPIKKPLKCATRRQLIAYFFRGLMLRIWIDKEILFYHILSIFYF